MKKYKLLMLYLVSFAITANLYAHNIKIFAAQKSDNICGYVYSPGGVRIKNSTISVYKNTEFITKIKTDTKGTFKYKVADDANYRFVYSKNGHLAEYSVNKPVGKKKSKIDAGINNDSQIFAIKEQLDRIENTMRIRDIIGAIGYIFGVFGLIILLKKKKS
ncbi:MAG: hypothetical protein KOO69_06750 [Victivallales bacterium]|nr:hypothetical protein [Victivallales bacterium]